MANKDRRGLFTLKNWGAKGVTSMSRTRSSMKRAKIEKTFYKKTRKKS